MGKWTEPGTSLEAKYASLLPQKPETQTEQQRPNVTAAGETKAE